MTAVTYRYRSGRVTIGTFYFLVGVGLPPRQPRGWCGSGPAMFWPLFLIALGVGMLLRRARRLQVEEDRSAQLAVAEERVRIARELHDIVAHGVSLMTIQITAARRVADTKPDAAEQSLAAAEQTGRQTLNELDSMLAVLRGADASIGAAAGTRRRRPGPVGDRPAGERRRGRPGPDGRRCPAWPTSPAWSAVLHRGGPHRQPARPGRPAPGAGQRRAGHLPGGPGGADQRRPLRRRRRHRGAAHLRPRDHHRVRRRRRAGPRPRWAARAAATACSGCPSGWPPSAARSKPGRGTRVPGGGSTPRSRVLAVAA